MDLTACIIRRLGAAVATGTLALAAMGSAAPSAFAQDAAQVGMEKVAERASAECRRAGDGTDGAVTDEQCAGPVGRRVIRSEVEAHRSSWLHRALDLQYVLAHDTPLRDAPWIGTHNSFNSTSELPTASHTDSNQQLSLTDQLRIDMRSLEIDVHWFPSARAGGQPAPVVCHATGEHAGCTTERLLGDVLDEIAAWLRENEDQVLLLYVEDNLGSEQGYSAAADELSNRLRAADGRSLVYSPSGGGAACQKLPLDLTRGDVLAAGAQVILVSSCGPGAGWRGTVFDWDGPEVESRPDGYRDLPDCDPEFDRATYDEHLVRYFEDSTWVTAAASTGGAASADDGLTPETVARMTRCGVDLLSMDQILPRDGRLEALVWSWDVDEPRAGAGSCAVQVASGRWRARACAEHHPVACRTADGSWSVARPAVPYRVAEQRCRGQGAALAVPRTGHENALLRAAAASAGADEVWLGHRLEAGRWTAADPR